MTTCHEKKYLKNTFVLLLLFKKHSVMVLQFKKRVGDSLNVVQRSAVKLKFYVVIFIKAAA